MTNNKVEKEEEKKSVSKKTERKDKLPSLVVFFFEFETLNRVDS